GHAAAHCNLGNVLADLGRREEAIAELREAVRLQPDMAQPRERLRQLGAAVSD
ncbi:MAG TPA: tetratricopeptide repeat protein, partial [Verrucomicrobiota bacterium]|nr:tetratricopeptide repeat protein [Verrucomicrobiota bacterium]